MRDAATDVAEEPLTYQEARRRDRVDRAAVVVESAEGERFVPENSGDAWSEERQKEPRLAATTDARNAWPRGNNRAHVPRLSKS